MISTGDLSQLAILLNILGYTPGGGGGGGVTPRQVQEFAFNYEPATGLNDAFIVNLTPTVTSLTDGLIIAMSSGSLQNNTDSPTLQVNALAPKPIVLWGGAPAPGDIETNASYLFIYNEAGDNFQLINPSLTTANTFLVQGNDYNNAIDTGAVNAYEVTLLINPNASFSVGFPIYMQVSPGNDNTGASTLTVNGVTDDIVLNNGSALSAGMLIGNQIAYFLYNGGNWILMNPATSGTGFVQSVTGDDANQVIVDNTDPENPVLSLPQDIAPTSDVTFASLTSTNDSIINNKTIGTGGGNQFSNTVFGIEALFSNVDGDNNVAIGDNALRSNISGIQSVAVGANAAVAATGGLLTAIGEEALADNVDGAANSSLGYLSGQGVVSGSYNTSVGAGSGVNDPDAADTIALGANAIADAATGNTSSDDGAGIAIGSGAHPVGFRGDGTPYPAGAGANYWRAKINSEYYKIPLLNDDTGIMWPDATGLVVLEGSSPTFDDLELTGAIIGANGFNVAQFSDSALATDYFHILASTLNGAAIQLMSSATDASFSILAKGEGGVVIGSSTTAGVNYIPMVWAAGTYGITHQIPGLTSNRTILYPDGNVTLVPGTMVTETQGTWTPIDASGAGLTLSSGGSWAKIGDVVFAWCNVSYPVTANASAAIIGGLPFSGGDNTHNGASIVFTNSATANKLLMNGGGGAGTTANIYTASGTAVTNAGMTNTTNFFSFCYGV